MIKFNNNLYTDEEWAKLTSLGEIDENFIVTLKFINDWDETLIRLFIKKELPDAEIIEVKKGVAKIRIATYDYKSEFGFEKL